MFLMSPKTPNTREAKLYNDQKSRNSHSVIGLWYTIVYTIGKSLIHFFIIYRYCIWDLPERHDFAQVYLG